MLIYYDYYNHTGVLVVILVVIVVMAVGMVFVLNHLVQQTGNTGNSQRSPAALLAPPSALVIQAKLWRIATCKHDGNRGHHPESCVHFSFEEVFFEDSRGEANCEVVLDPTPGKGYASLGGPSRRWPASIWLRLA